MSALNQGKKDILEMIWRKDKALSLRQVAEETGLPVRATNMHLLGLRKTGYVSMLEDGCFIITDEGKVALGLPRIEKRLAQGILGKTAAEKAFHFYVEVDQPLGISSDSLVDFCEKILIIDLRSLEFHVPRGDFELWVHYLGDMEMAKRLRLIRESSLSGSVLRKEIYRTVKSRCDELQKLAS